MKSSDSRESVGFGLPVELNILRLKCLLIAADREPLVNFIVEISNFYPSI